MDEMVLVTHCLSKATEHLSRCHSNAKLHFSSSVTAHIFCNKNTDIQLRPLEMHPKYQNSKILSYSEICAKQFAT